MGPRTKEEPGVPTITLAQRQEADEECNCGERWKILFEYFKGMECC